MILSVIKISMEECQLILDNFFRKTELSAKTSMKDFNQIVHDFCCKKKKAFANLNMSYVSY